MRCTCEYASRKAWNDAIEAAASQCAESEWRVADEIRALKRDNLRPSVAYREVEPPTYVEGLPGFLK